MRDTVVDMPRRPRGSIRAKPCSVCVAVWQCRFLPKEPRGAANEVPVCLLMCLTHALGCWVVRVQCHRETWLARLWFWRNAHLYAKLSVIWGSVAKFACYPQGVGTEPTSQERRGCQLKRDW